MAKKTGHNKKRQATQRSATPKAPPKPVIRTPILLILSDQEATKKVMEAILESTNGKRTLSRFARTCKAFCGPALDILWRELDSLVPIIGLFPNNILKKARKPGFGLVCETIIQYVLIIDVICDTYRSRRQRARIGSTS